MSCTRDYGRGEPSRVGCSSAENNHADDESGRFDEGKCCESLAEVSFEADGCGKELNGNAPRKKGASLKRSAAEKTDIEGTKKSKTENEDTDDAVAAAAEINVTATTTNGAPGAHDGKDSGESSDGRDASNSGGENDSKNP